MCFRTESLCVMMSFFIFAIETVRDYTPKSIQSGKLTAHDPRVDLLPQKTPLESLVGYLQVEGITHGYGALQWTVCTFFTHILPVVSKITQS